METSIKDGWVYNAISRCKNIIGDPDCACGSEASLVRNMTRDVEGNIDRINAEDCGSCGMCGDCSIEELTKESEVRQHEYTCQQSGYEEVWASTYKELEHCQGKKHRYKLTFQLQREHSLASNCTGPIFLPPRDDLVLTDPNDRSRNVNKDKR